MPPPWSSWQIFTKYTNSAKDSNRLTDKVDMNREENYNNGEIIQTQVTWERGELKAACRHFKQDYAAILARPRVAREIVFDYRGAKAEGRAS